MRSGFSLKHIAYIHGVLFEKGLPFKSMYAVYWMVLLPSDNTYSCLLIDPNSVYEVVTDKFTY